VRFATQRTLLIHAQCEGEQLEFRFPLYVIHVTSGEAARLLNQILQGDVCVLLVRNQFATEELTGSYFNEVEAITVHPLFEGRFA
jgi:hypothetical protein